MDKYLKQLGLLFLALALVPFLLYWMKAEGLAGVPVGDFLSQGSILMPTVVNNETIEWTQADEDKRINALHEKSKLRVPVSKVSVKKPQESPLKGKCTSKVRTDLVNHAYKISGGDMKFLGTISSESSWDIGAIGDGGMSVGLCQFHKHFQPDNHRIYKTLKTDKEKLEFCYEKYEIWRKRGVLSTRLYGSNVWQNGLKKLEIKCE